MLRGYFNFFDVSFLICKVEKNIFPESFSKVTMKSKYVYLLDESVYKALITFKSLLIDTAFA